VGRVTGLTNVLPSYIHRLCGGPKALWSNYISLFRLLVLVVQIKRIDTDVYKMELEDTKYQVRDLVAQMIAMFALQFRVLH